uniref:Uncharacterized protein n=1 Tax=Fagus sylvatica TaxID=28930 RepID=A0A2N9EK33_FAGSY
MEEQPSLLLQRYRRDRRNLLEFLFSSGLIKELRTPAGPITALSDLDFDNLSADYVLHSIKSDGVVDISEATKKYFDESSYPVMIHSRLGNSYFLLSDPDLSGSPPRRAPPPTDVKRTADHASCSSREPDPLIVENIGASMDNFSPKYKATTGTSLSALEDVNIPPLGLPCLNTGFLKDYLMMTYGNQPMKSCLHLWVDIQLRIEGKRRVQAFVRAGFIKDTDSPSSLILCLDCEFETSNNFVSDGGHGVASILEELLYFSANIEASERATIKSSLAKIRNSKEWDITMSPSERAEVLSAITQVDFKLSSLSGKFSIQGETYYWTAGYHLNIGLYEKLLFGVFDVLDEGQLIEVYVFLSQFPLSGFVT